MWLKIGLSAVAVFLAASAVAFIWSKPSAKTAAPVAPQAPSSASAGGGVRIHDSEDILSADMTITSAPADGYALDLCGVRRATFINTRISSGDLSPPPRTNEGDHDGKPSDGKGPA